MTREKIRYIYLPFFGIAIGLIAVYTYLHWLLFIHLRLWNMHEDVLTVFFPMLLPSLPVFIWMKPRLKLLRLQGDDEEKVDEDGDLYWNPIAEGIILGILFIIIPCIAAQYYMRAATETLLVIDKINDIYTNPPADYYVIRHYDIDTLIHAFNNYISKNKNDDDIALHLSNNFVCRIYTPGADSPRHRITWIGMHYTSEMSDRFTDSGAQHQLALYCDENWQDWKKATDAHGVAFRIPVGWNGEDSIEYRGFRYVYLKRLYNTGAYYQYTKAIAKLIPDAEEQVVLEPSHESFAQRKGNSPLLTVILFLSTMLLWVLRYAWVPFDEDKLKAYVEQRWSS